MKTLSIVIPVYNEKVLVTQLLDLVVESGASGMDKELVIVNDGSSDGTDRVLDEYAEAFDESKHENVTVRVYHQVPNQGKGAALRRGFKEATGDIVLIQDADLEYDPEDYPLLLKPILAEKADVVYGSRFLGGTHRVLFFWHYVGNRFLTTLSNMFTNLNLSDMETCYKAFRKDVIDRVELEQNRFGFEPEVTAKFARLKVRIFEVPISYYGRTYAEGKKIGWKDGFAALYCIVRYGLFK